MTYSSIVEMARSASLNDRIAAAAADEGMHDRDPAIWAKENIWQIVSYDNGWAAAWDYAVDTATLDNNPDTGARPGVINDGMILTVVQAIMTAEAGS